MFPGTGTVIDMGGQDTKAIRIKGDGEIIDFCMNDKCAAGTGRFLGAAAKALGMTLDDLGPTALKSRKPVKISTTCIVFAEAEILSWVGKGKAIEDILWRVHKSIATRSFGLLKRVGVVDEITFTGGVARNPGFSNCTECPMSDMPAPSMMFFGETLSLRWLITWDFRLRDPSPSASISGVCTVFALFPKI